jgi:DNA polymerase-3 subunit beta
MVHFAMAQQDIRYYLNGMLLVVDGATVRAVATDGHRLALCEVTKDGGAGGKIEAIIPRKTVLELSRLLPDSDAPVRVQMATNQIKVSFEDIELVSKLVEGKFPDYQRVLPASNTKVFALGREDLMHALQRAAILTTDKFKGVRMLLAAGTLKIMSTNADQEDAQDELEIDYAGDGLDIGFNVNYLLDVLSNLKNEQVRFALGDALGSALITMPDSEKFKYVVMPMRI